MTYLPASITADFEVRTETDFFGAQFSHQRSKCLLILSIQARIQDAKSIRTVKGYRSTLFAQLGAQSSVRFCCAESIMHRCSRNLLPPDKRHKTSKSQGVEGSIFCLQSVHPGILDLRGFEAGQRAEKNSSYRDRAISRTAGHSQPIYYA